MTILNVNAEIEVKVIGETEELLEAIATHIQEQFPHNDNFIVLDDDTKEDYLVESQEDMLWAFNTSFVMQHLKEDIKADLNTFYAEQMENSLAKMQERMWEGANGLIKGITNWEEMIIEGASVDGYGHFLNGYDGNEYEFEFDGETYYIYFNN